MYEIREIKTTAKGPNQENREILTTFYSINDAYILYVCTLFIRQ